jgi:hypothetical protein
VRQTDGYREAAREVFRKHGSRGRRLEQDRQKSAPEESPQMMLPL